MIRKSKKKSFILALDEEAFKMILDIVNEYISLIVLDKLKLSHTFNEVDELRHKLVSIFYDGDDTIED